VWSFSILPDKCYHSTSTLKLAILSYS
jgi:hypothetical protein